MPELSRQFVLLRHELPDGVHWDLMLETGVALATWRIGDDPAGWALRPGRLSLPARRLADHRRAYLDYEGPVSGDRGRVSRVDAGYYHLLDYQPGRWDLRLTGSLLTGEYRLMACSARDPDDWQLQRVPTARS